MNGANPDYGKLKLREIAITVGLALALLATAGSYSAFGQSPPSINDLFVQLNSTIPGFGGMYVDPGKDTVYVLVVNGALLAPAQVGQSVASVLGSDMPPESNTVILPANYTFVQLKGWQDYTDPEILSIPGVVSTGIHHSANRLRIGVSDHSARKAVESELRALGVPADAVEIVDEAQPNLQACTSVQSQCRPLVGGLQIHADKDPDKVFSTFTFNATRKGVDGFVTCSHCANVIFKNTGTMYDQNLKGNAQIGKEIANPGLVANLGGAFVCPAKSVCRLSDSSFAQFAGAPATKVGFLARPKLNQTDWNGTDYFRIVAAAKSIEGENVAKVGRTTGFTQGKITGVCRNINYPKQKKDDPQPVLVCQNSADYDTDAGDSGAPVFLCAHSTKPCSLSDRFDVFLLGIHEAGLPHNEKGDRYYSDIGLVQDGNTELGPLTKFCDPAAKDPNCS